MRQFAQVGLRAGIAQSLRLLPEQRRVVLRDSVKRGHADSAELRQIAGAFGRCALIGTDARMRACGRGVVNPRKHDYACNRQRHVLALPEGECIGNMGRACGLSYKPNPRIGPFAVQQTDNAGNVVPCIRIGMVGGKAVVGNDGLHSTGFRPCADIGEKRAVGVAFAAGNKAAAVYIDDDVRFVGQAVAVEFLVFVPTVGKVAPDVFGRRGCGGKQLVGCCNKFWGEAAAVYPV